MAFTDTPLRENAVTLSLRKLLERQLAYHPWDEKFVLVRVFGLYILQLPKLPLLAGKSDALDRRQEPVASDDTFQEHSQGEIEFPERSLVCRLHGPRYRQDPGQNAVVPCHWVGPDGMDCGMDDLIVVSVEKTFNQPERPGVHGGVALVDEPDVSYQHFSRLARLLREQGVQSAKARVRATRQLNLCTWVLFVWARDTGNVEAAYRASEVAMLSVWHLLRPLIGKSSRDAKDLTYSIRQMIDLHLTIASELLERTVFPHTGVLHGVSMAVGSREASDVNLALFDILGRIGMAALWIKWVGDVQGATDLAGQGIAKFVGHGLALIDTNPALLLPATDRQATDVALFLFAWSQSGAPGTQAQDWLRQMATRFDFTIRTRGRYPIVSVDYRDIVAHTHDRSDAYFEETTSGSSLLPLIASWLHAFGDDEAVEALAKLQRDKLDHSTWQLWLPDEDTEQGLYSGEDPGGHSLNDLSLQEGGGQLLEIIAAACKEGEGLRVLTACATGYWPIVLVACRHHHLPVPPGFWIDVLIPEVAPA